MKPARPPRTPAEWTTGPPEFVGIGTQRGGSSWWYQLIEDHPGVCIAPGRQKELHFFDQFRRAAFGARHIAEYQSYFPRPPGSISGEWTPRYMFDSWTPGLIAQAAPNARLIAILRDPIERYRSGLTHALVAGAPASEVVIRDTFLRGLYHEQLTRFLHHFPADQILVLQFEQCRQHPIGNLQHTYRHIGLEPSSHTPPTLFEKVNLARMPKVELTNSARAALVEAYRIDAQRLAQNFDSVDLTLWPDLA